MRGLSKTEWVVVVFVTSMGLGGDVASAGINVWTSNGPEGRKIRSLAIDPVTSAMVYAGTDGGGVYKSVDGGGSWTAVNIGLTVFSILALAIDPAAPATVYAATNAGGVFKSADGGGTWTAVNNGLGRHGAWALAIDPVTPATIYAGTGGDGVFKSVDGGGSWTAVGPVAAITGILALAIDPVTPAMVYAATDGNGVFKSPDGGGTWTAVNTGLASPYVFALAIDPVTPATVYAATLVGLFKSVDGAGSWIAVNTGPPNVLALAVDPVAPKTMYVATIGGGIFRSADGGGRWIPFNNGLSNTDFTSLAIDSTGKNLHAGSDAYYGGTGVYDYTVATPASFYTLTPCRVADTRNPVGPYGGPALAANADRTFVIGGQCGIPSTAAAVSLNFTVTQPTAQGDLRALAAGVGLPLVSTMNWRAGQTRANNAIVSLGPSGDIVVHVDQASGTVHFIIDVNGYFQ